MIATYLYLFLYVYLVYAIGFVTYGLFSKFYVARLNIFLNIALSWALGSFVTMLFLYILAITNSLAVFTFQNFFWVLGAVSFLLLLSFYRLFKLKIRIFPANILVLAIVGIFFIPLVRDSLYSYLVSWDAVAIWFFKAKVFFLHEGVWINNFFTDTSIYTYSHRAYPIGFPLLISGYYRLIGLANDQVSQFIPLQFYLNLMLLFFGIVLHIFKKGMRLILLLFAISLIIFPNIVIYSHNGYADVAISFYIAILTCLLIFVLEMKKNVYELSILSIVISISASLVKNEGIALFCIVEGTILAGLIFALIRKKGEPVKIILYIVLPLLVGVVAILSWGYIGRVLSFPTDSYLLGGQSLSIVSRIKLIFNQYVLELGSTAKYSFIVTLGLFIFVFQSTIYLFSRKFRRFIPLYFVVLQFAVYTFIYLRTGVQLQWQLTTSYDRLFLQVLPGFLIVVVYQIQFLPQGLQWFLKDSDIKKKD